MTGTENEDRRVRYTVMPDHGGAYGWINRDGTDTLGPNHADDSGWRGDHPISDELHAALAAWQIEFEQAPLDLDQVADSIDWRRFHERGLALSRQLKVELGEMARVFYVKPIEDPNSRANSRVEVLPNGSEVERPWECHAGSRRPEWLPRLIVSGGQTGADRAALDWAIGHRFVHGGWCPKGRVASDGPIPLRYQLRETESASYRQRTKLNVQDSDATLLLNTGELDGGTLQTVRFAQTMGKPHLVIQLDQAKTDDAAQRIVAWLTQGQFSTLNVAGPREEKRPGMYALVLSALERCLARGEQ